MSEIGQSPQAIHCRITRELSRLTVTTGYVVKQVYSDGSEFSVGRKHTRAEARKLAEWHAAHYGNLFKIVRLYRKVRNK